MSDTTKSASDVSAVLMRHYAEKFDAHGATPRGVDWRAQEDADLRYAKMIAVMDDDLAHVDPPSLLDVGCGYGALLDVMRKRGRKVQYTGIDMCANMITWGQSHHAGVEFIVGDVLTECEGRTFDYVVCNGILTQKLDVAIAEMDKFAQRLIRRMFHLCRRGVAFNVMTTKVNFMVPNLYYRNPVELMAWCMAEITPRLRLDHAYPLYEYTLYLYRDKAD